MQAQSVHARDAGAVESSGEDIEDAKRVYLESLSLIERLHRRFLDVVKAELDAIGLQDVNNVQSLILYNIGDDVLTVGELTNRGYYLGSNVSYNVKKLVENGYLVQERSEHDRRTTRVHLSDKGLAVVSSVNAMFEHNVDALSRIGLRQQTMQSTIDNLRVLERFWSDYINYGPR